MATVTLMPNGSARLSPDRTIDGAAVFLVARKGRAAAAGSMAGRLPHDRLCRFVGHFRHRWKVSTQVEDVSAVGLTGRAASAMEAS
jgi:hypothetical protein